jgi:phthalate 4,5-cis-dihydrodiol dehydrogenase
LKRLKLGVAGLGRAFSLMRPTFLADRRVELVAAADPRAEARRRFELEFNGKTFDSVEALCADPLVEVVYVATPHQFHAHHACVAAAHGRHVLVEKPMALTLEECRAMIDAARSSGVQLIVGPSHGFDAPIRRAREIIDSGAVGRVRMITAFNFTDYLYRPRRPEELDTARGGGAVFNQAAHQVDVVRLLGGGRVSRVRAHTGRWDEARPTEGAYAALLTFEDGAFASIVYSGYAHFDSDEFVGWVGEMGRTKDPARYGEARRVLATSPDEARLKSSRNYGNRDDASPIGQALHEHFGVVIVSCDRADLRPLPHGVMIHGDRAQRLDSLPTPVVPRAEVIDELYDAVVDGRPPVHSGEWAMATLEVCLAILRSARDGTEISLETQAGLKQTAAARR